MDTFEYSFTGKSGDRYVVKIQKDGNRLLSPEMNSRLHLSDMSVWGIYLNKIGNSGCVTSIRDLSIISKQIYGFFMSHGNAVLYYVCDDMADVPMNARKKAEGYSVQYYRNRLFTGLFQKIQTFMKVDVVDLPICIDACGNDMYIHVIARNVHLNVAMAIKQDVLQGFSK